MIKEIKMKKFLAVIGIMLLGCAPVSSQVYRLPSINLSGTISVTNTFQSVQIQADGRGGCTIQNGGGTNAMWVFFGPIANATKAKSFILDATHGETISCGIPFLPGLITDQISITGTSGDTFTANFQ